MMKRREDKCDLDTLRARAGQAGLLAGFRGALDTFQLDSLGDQLVAQLNQHGMAQTLTTPSQPEFKIILSQL